MEQTTTPNFAHELSRRFHERYSKVFAEINSKLTKAYSQDDYFDVPVSKLALPPDGGFTEIVGNPDAFALKEAAVVKTVMEKHSMFTYVLRVKVPWPEVEATHNDPKYFEKYFDKLVQEVYSTVESKYGAPGVGVQFGDKYIDYVTPQGHVFLENDGGESLELRFIGKFPGEKK